MVPDVRIVGAGLQSAGLRHWEVIQGHDQIQLAVAYTAEKIPTRKKKTKVLLLTYMRGGSTLLGEMLNQNPDATLWFEPVDGVYSQLYGTVHGWFPLDILYTDNGSPRPIPGYEEDAIMEQFNNIMSCDINNTATHIVGHFAMVNIPQKRFRPYIDCLKKVHNKYHITTSACQRFLSNVCPKYFSVNTTTLASCQRCLHPARYHGIHSNIRRTKNSTEKITVDPVCSKFSNYTECMDNYHEKSKQCLPVLGEICENSTIVGVKTIRLRADTALKLLEDHPDLRLVYEMRDPRGTAFSRRSNGLLSRLSKRDIVNETRLVCERIKFECKIVQEIQRRYPERVLLISYEDLVLRPVEATDTFYKFIGETIPQVVSTYMNYSTHSAIQGTAYNTIRKNGTASLYKWRNLPTDKQRAMTEVCVDVLRTFGYPTSIENTGS